MTKKRFKVQKSWKNPVVYMLGTYGGWGWGVWDYLYRREVEWFPGTPEGYADAHSLCDTLRKEKEAPPWEIGGQRLQAMGIRVKSV